MTPRRFKCTRFRKGILDYSLECITLLQNDFFKQRYITFNVTIPGQDRIDPNTYLCRTFLLGIVYPWPGVRRCPSSVVRRPSSSTMLKHLLLRNRSADQSQILFGASLGRGNEILFAASGSRNQDGRNAHMW